MSKIIDSLVDETEEFLSDKKLARRQRCFDSNLNRLSHWMETKEIAAITAWRGALENVVNESKTLIDKPLDGTEKERTYSKEENRQRNKKLAQALIAKGYGITKISGHYLEDGDKLVEEESYFVVNLRDDPKFKQNLFKLSEWFNQDSFLYKPLGSKDVYLISTNGNKSQPYGTEMNIGSFLSNVSDKYATRIGNKGFVFGDRKGKVPFQNKSFSENKKERIKDSELPDFYKYRHTPEQIGRLFYSEDILNHGLFMGMGLSKQLKEDIKDGLMPDLYE